MGVIMMTSWTDGLCKVSLIKLQMNILQISLVDSKKNVDDLLDEKSIVITTRDNEVAKDFIFETKKIGVICHYLEDTD